MIKRILSIILALAVPLSTTGAPVIISQSQDAGNNIQFDADSEGTGDVNPVSWTHTPVGTPRGIVVFIMNNNDNDVISGCTYGGTSMTQIGNAADATGEPGFTEAYFLGSSVPTGAQTVSCTVTAGTNSKHGVAMSFTANGDTQVTGTYCTVLDDIQSPSCTVTGTSETLIAVAATHSGYNAVTDMTAGSGYTEVHDHDYGLQTTSTIRLTTPASGNPTPAFSTAGINDVAMVGLAIK